MNEKLHLLQQQFQGSKGRTTLAVFVGAIAMLLLLLSELLPKASSATVPAAKDTDARQYQTQLEEQLAELISQLQGAGKTTVMVTLTTGEETVYAVDTQTGELQRQEQQAEEPGRPHWPKRPICRRCAALQCCVKGEAMSVWQPVLRNCSVHYWRFHPTGSVWSSANPEL